LDLSLSLPIIASHGVLAIKETYYKVNAIKETYYKVKET
jgi:hypothetical protein